MQPTSPNTHYAHPGFPHRCDVTDPYQIAAALPDNDMCIGQLILHYFPLASVEAIEEAITIKNNQLCER